jgi:TRAP-type C4-dicarboxylate transport system substrate-binding protein
MCSYGAIYQGVIPEAVILPGPPYAWDNANESFDAFYNRGLLDVANALHAKHNVYFVPHITTGIRFIGSKVPIDTLAKLKGMKIRAIGTDAKYLEKFGASTVNIPGPDIYMGIKTGIVDATLISLSAINQYFDVWKHYVIYPNYGGDNGALLFNLKSWNALPDDIKFIFDKALKYQTLYSGAFTFNETAKKMHEGRTKYGIQFVRWSPEDTAKALETAMPIYDDLAKISPDARKMIDIIRQQMKEVGKMK